MAFDPEDIERPFQVARFTYGENTIDAPAVILPTPNGDIVCHWGNTLVRCFRFQSEIDHIEYYEEDERPNGIYVERELLDAFIAHAYPVRRDPFVDSATMEWYLGFVAGAGDLDSELDELLGE
jgi:hypothetical protein